MLIQNLDLKQNLMGHPGSDLRGSGIAYPVEIWITKRMSIMMSEIGRLNKVKMVFTWSSGRLTLAERQQV